MSTPEPILTDDEIEAAFTAHINKRDKRTKEQRAFEREDFEREMADRMNHRFDAQAHYDAHKGLI